MLKSLTDIKADRKRNNATLQLKTTQEERERALEMSEICKELEGLAKQYTKMSYSELIDEFDKASDKLDEAIKVFSGLSVAMRDASDKCEINVLRISTVAEALRTYETRITNTQEEFIAMENERIAAREARYVERTERERLKLEEQQAKRDAKEKAKQEAESKKLSEEDEEYREFLIRTYGKKRAMELLKEEGII